MQVCATPGYLAAQELPTDPARLLHHDCIVDSNYPGKDRWVLGSGQQSSVVRVKSKIQVNSARAARALVLANRGIGYLPSFTINDDIERGRLIPLFPDYSTEAMGIYAVYTHRKHLSAKVGRFIDIVKGVGNK